MLWDECKNDSQNTCPYTGQCIDSQKLNISIHILYHCTKAVCSSSWQADRNSNLGPIFVSDFKQGLNFLWWTIYSILFILLNHTYLCLWYFKYNLDIVHPKITIMASVLMQNTKNMFLNCFCPCSETSISYYHWKQLCCVIYLWLQFF